MPQRSKRAESRSRYFVRSQAKKRGWKPEHVSRGGDFLEEQEIVNHFPDIGLGLEKPDFLVCLGGEPVMVVETKNDFRKSDEAIEDAIGYARVINTTSRYDVRVAVGVAGEEDNGFLVEVRYLVGKNKWKPLLSHGCELTNIPSKREVELALQAGDGTTTVTLPSLAEFIDSAIELSRILRAAKVEAPLRPKVIGAMVLAMYQGTIDTDPQYALRSVNALVQQAISESADLQKQKKAQLVDALKLSGADFNRMAPYIRRITTLLRRLNVRSVMHTDADFLGTFYEAFLRYGYDNNALGIVFTPRHITKFCVQLIGAGSSDQAIDIACGTGGFLVSAFDEMVRTAKSPRAIEKIKNSIFGFDTNPTVWALALLNMFFRGDGKSNIENVNCFGRSIKKKVRMQFSRAFLNPPFSQDEEPERDFIDASLEALEPGGKLAAVVKAGIFADDEHQSWRRELIRRHTVLAVISLPEDLFYPTASPTSILVAKAHEPQPPDSAILMARIWDDGFEKLKNRRVEHPGNQLPDVLRAYKLFSSGKHLRSPITAVVKGSQVRSGEELSPQQWLPQSALSPNEQVGLQQDIIRSMFQAVAALPELASVVLKSFCSDWAKAPNLPVGRKGTLQDFFHVLNGKSTGEKNYTDGPCPYISSGDTVNSIIRLILPEEEEVFPAGGITVTAFGQAYIQPWPFAARGNGGSSVRVLIPKYNMNFRELLWFAGQINAQRWRFFYARMAIKSRLERLTVLSPYKRLVSKDRPIAERLCKFRESLFSLSTVEPLAR